MSGTTGVVPTGNVHFTFYNNGSCRGDGWSHYSGLSGGTADSPVTHPLAPGNYSYNASYTGDDNYYPSVASCEPFSVGMATPPVNTTVNNGSTEDPWSGTETTGATAYDTATVTGVDVSPPVEVTPSVDNQWNDFTPTGTVTYSFFTNGECSGDPSSTQTVQLEGGSVPPSDTTDPLSGGDYSYQATYNGDDNYTSSTGDCQPFTVLPADPGATTTVFDGSNNTAWAGTETVGATAYDTSTVKGVTGFDPIGTVTYTLFTNGTCNGTGTNETVTITGGALPHTAATSALSVGSYSYSAAYSGDTNYAPASGSREPFAVAAVVTSPAATPPATLPATTPTVVTTPLAFTGADIAGMVAGGLVLLGAGGLLVLTSRRRRQQRAGS